ncbi:hypothetical protein C8J57DRAFT_1252290 [Mycena rebaudengoi]|nr:hypothetical protein C8J57DRAFT_1252290 [Mycena rebaudengoi]
MDSTAQAAESLAEDGSAPLDQNWYTFLKTAVYAKLLRTLDVFATALPSVETIILNCFSCPLRNRRRCRRDRTILCCLWGARTSTPGGHRLGILVWLGYEILVSLMLRVVAGFHQIVVEPHRTRYTAKIYERQGFRFRRNVPEPVPNCWSCLREFFEASDPEVLLKIILTFENTRLFELERFVEQDYSARQLDTHYQKFLFCNTAVPAKMRERNFYPKKLSSRNPFPQICGNEISFLKNSPSAPSLRQRRQNAAAPRACLALRGTAVCYTANQTVTGEQWNDTFWVIQVDPVAFHRSANHWRAVKASAR